MDVARTQGISLHHALEGCGAHRFGLPADRWRALGGQAFWITGAGTGYGQALALALAAAGAKVVLSGRRLAKLEGTVARAAQAGIEADRFFLVPVDITDGPSLKAAGETLRREDFRLRGLVNNAALPPFPSSFPLIEGEAEAWDRLMATNVTGQWRVSQAALTLREPESPLRVLFMSSEAGWTGTSGFGPYNISKAALNALTLSLAMECRARWPDADLQINALDPGEAATEMNGGSVQSPYAVVPMALALLSHPQDGPTGRFFHRDGRHLAFTQARPYGRDLLEPKVGDPC